MDVVTLENPRGGDLSGHDADLIRLEQLLEHLTKTHGEERMDKFLASTLR